MSKTPKEILEVQPTIPAPPIQVTEEERTHMNETREKTVGTLLDQAGLVPMRPRSPKEDWQARPQESRKAVLESLEEQVKEWRSNADPNSPEGKEDADTLQVLVEIAKYYLES